VWILSASVWLLAFGWLWQLVQWIRCFPRISDLHRVVPDQQLDLTSGSSKVPYLTVIVPACNEEASIGACLRSLLASEGLLLQIIAIDDRSADATGSIMDKIRATVDSDRSAKAPGHIFEVLHVRELPAGWLGKPHALATGAGLAKADWILFTDGDVIFAPETLELALRWAKAEKADHLVLMPHWVNESHGEAAMHGAMHALTTWTFRPWRVADPEAKDFIGVGAFNLFRRSVYEELGGFSSLRMEVIEDLRLGWKLKRAGYRQRFALGEGLAAVRWSHGAWGVVRNLEKNLFALYRYNVGLTILVSIGLAIQIVLPVVALTAGGVACAGALALYGSVAGIYIVSRNVTRVNALYVLVYPFALSLFLFALLRSMTLALVRGGVVWRGTRYSLKELRAHAGRFW
jgi:glycosyltransferase involved in cell wall biosynthesis